MTGSSQGDQGRVRIEMALPAPIEDVYAAWTQPAAMARWLAPMGSVEVEADVRVGGRFRVVMIGDGMTHPTHRGVPDHRATSPSVIHVAIALYGCRAERRHRDAHSRRRPYPVVAPP
jgi:hypothetical protein